MCGGIFTQYAARERPRFPSASTLVVYLNHPSWWDPITILLLSNHLRPEADHYGPMDAKALERYGLFRRMGAFPVAAGKAEGVPQFLGSARLVLEHGGVLWVTPEGQFTDNRTRPVTFKSGLSHLISQMGRITLLPIALEYTYWDEKAAGDSGELRRAFAHCRRARGRGAHME